MPVFVAHPLTLAQGLDLMKAKEAFTFEDRARHLQDSDNYPHKLEVYIQDLEALKAAGEYPGRIPSLHALKKWRTEVERKKIFEAVNSKFALGDEGSACARCSYSWLSCGAGPGVASRQRLQLKGNVEKLGPDLKRFYDECLVNGAAVTSAILKAKAVELSERQEIKAVINDDWIWRWRQRFLAAPTTVKGELTTRVDNNEEGGVDSSNLYVQLQHT